MAGMAGRAGRARGAGGADPPKTIADLFPNSFIWKPFRPDLDQAMPSRTRPVAYNIVRH